MRSLIIALLTLSTAALPAPDLEEPPQTIHIISQRSPQRNNKQPKPLSLNYNKNTPQKPQSTIYIPIYVPTSRATATPTWPAIDYTNPYPTSSWAASSLSSNNYNPPPNATPSAPATSNFTPPQNIAPVLTTIMITVTRGGIGAPLPTLNLGTLVPQAPPPVGGGGGAFEDDDWR
jgi:hypothetical protein